MFTKQTKILAVMAALAAVSLSFLQAHSPYESSADFAQYAMKLRSQALLRVEPPVLVPRPSRFAPSRSLTIGRFRPIERRRTGSEGGR